ncbi:branched-chain amino acid ABC transporter permease [Paenibacillus validus]|uniref:Branched-chain amino acid ABC transporter permease n=1 Tax=Paenibacillus validus TaxID=44253 RepID=A0A7X3CRU8_9BACL|nr:branched-chain amino acid ABC transporter permease [Paenibacillus validus]MED4601901.1 branched-chain amino acid ABC transporter permease [Paenibacillus validus]MED4606417.1 branched-chain amino acid ABC transporter permease [Paenibacillus validus]MUG70061.1 branched-chain amino acid ABC transporter permease [Paenibacillus validus]
MLRNHWVKKVLLALVVLLMAVYPLLVGYSNYFLTLFSITCIYIISSLSLNILVGYGGQVSVGHAGFLVIGSYTVAILGERGVPFFVSFLMAGIVSGVIGLLIGLPAVRLRGHFLAVATLGFGLSVPLLVLNWDSLTKGYQGMAVSRPVFLSSDIEFFYVIVAMTVLVTWFIRNIVASSLGRAFVAIRDSEVAAQAMGIHVALYKTVMFVISAFFTGLAGGLYAYWLGYISPSDFSVTTSFLLLAMIVVGGLASIPGAIIGTILFSVLPHFTEHLIGMHSIVIGSAMALIILLRPAGLVSLKGLFKRKLNKTVAEDRNSWLSQQAGGE